MNYERRTIDTNNKKYNDYSEFLSDMMRMIMEDMRQRGEQLLGGIRPYKNTFHVKTKFGLRSYEATKNFR